MKAILVIDVPSDYGDIADNKAIVTLRNGKVGTCLGIYNVPLKPMPERAFIDQGVPFNEGWNACLDAITGETE